MTDTIHTHNEFHLGDNFVHLHFLRGMARLYPGFQFVHAAHECHLKQLGAIVVDLPAIRLIRLEDKSPASIDSWKNAGGYFGNHPLRDDWCAYHLDWFSHLAELLWPGGLLSPFTRNEDLLFDYPALSRDWVVDGKHWWELVAAELRALLALRKDVWLFDYLVVNSRPCSGQLMAYDSVDYMDPLLRDLVAKGKTVLVTQPTEVPGVRCTQEWGCSLTEIGLLSTYCRHHVMVSTGPSWPCLNKWNYPYEQGSVRVLMLEREFLNFPGLTRCGTREEVMGHLLAKGAL